MGHARLALVLIVVSAAATTGVGQGALASGLVFTNSADAITAPDAITFDDATQDAGLTSADPALDPLKGAYIHASAWGDVDNDGDPDLFVGTFTDSPIGYYQQRGATGPAGNQLFLNDGDGTFTPADQPALNVFGRAAGAVFVDLDNDGWDDLIVSNNSYPEGSTTVPSKLDPNRLFRNAGNGTFVDVSATSGIEPEGFASGRAIGVLDYDADGCLDVFLVSDPFHGNLSSSRLLRGDCALGFTDVTASAGLAIAGGLLVQGLGVAVGDANDDGWPDIFVAGGPRGSERRNFLFLNRTDGTFGEVSDGAFDEPPGVIDAAEDWTSGAAFADLNRDGRLDLVVAHHYGSAEQASYGSQAEAFAPTVWLNTSTGAGDPTFANVTAGSGIVPIQAKSPHAEIHDLDNDGWPDISVSVVADLAGGTQPLVFRNLGADGQVGGAPTFSSPSFDPTSLHYYAGGPVADHDRDGRLDMFLNEFRPSEVPPLFRNTSEAAENGWLDVRASFSNNPSGIGARISIYEAGQLGNPSALLGTQEIQVGNGFSSAGLPLAHFGLGSHAAVDIATKAPFNGGTITRTGVAANQLVMLTPPSPGSDLSISQSHSPEPATVGAKVIFTVQVVNHGPDAALDLALTDRLPSNVAYATATTSEGVCSTADKKTMVLCTNPSLPAGATMTVRIVTKARYQGSSSNSGAVTVTTPDPDSTNNASVDTVTVVPRR